MFAPSSSSVSPQSATSPQPDVVPSLMNKECTRGPIKMTDVDFAMQHYVFPVQFAGMVSLAAYVLVSLFRSPRKHMAHPSFFVVTLVNVATIMCMLPRSLNTFEYFYSDEAYRRFNYGVEIMLNAFGNIFSAVDSFTVVLICFEYYCWAKGSKYVKNFLRSSRLMAIFIAVFLLAALISIVHFFEYKNNDTFACNGTKMIHRIVANTDVVSLEFTKVAHLVQAILVVVVPTILVCVLNYHTVNIIRNRKQSLISSESVQLFGLDDDLCRDQSRQVSYYLPAITVCFVFTHVASLFPFVMQWLMPHMPSVISFRVYSNSISILNSVLLSGKIANLLLLYVSSIHFVRTGLLSAR